MCHQKLSPPIIIILTALKWIHWQFFLSFSRSIMSLFISVTVDTHSCTVPWLMPLVYHVSAGIRSISFSILPGLTAGSIAGGDIITWKDTSLSIDWMILLVEVMNNTLHSCKYTCWICSFIICLAQKTFNLTLSWISSYYTTNMKPVMDVFDATSNCHSHAVYQACDACCEWDPNPTGIVCSGCFNHSHSCSSLGSKWLLTPMVLRYWRMCHIVLCQLDTSWGHLKGGNLNQENASVRSSCRQASKHFLNLWLVVEGPSHCGWCLPWANGHGSIRK